MDHSMDMAGGHDMGMDHSMGMGDMGGMGAGPMIFGMDLSILLMIVSGIFYLVCAFFVYKTYKKEKSELVGALLAFLVYQAISMFFMGIEMQTMNMLYGNIAGAAVIIGTAYMLKFPFSGFSEKTRRLVFLVLLVASLGIFAWFMQTPDRQGDLMSFVLWYDLIANGVLVGGSILLFGLRASEKSIKRKAVGGGAGVVSCCVAANGFMITGAMITSSLFAFLAPLFILFSLKSAKQNGGGSATVAAAPAPSAPASPAPEMPSAI